MPIVYQQHHHTPREHPMMTENHPTGQNPTPAHAAAAVMAIALCGLLTLTGEQLQHLGTATAVLSALWPMTATLTRRT
ncbi:hypothetical protein [Streptomyces parvus]|uniref:Uncharacterized protein n=1 Tax=Streptomyces parvus TaxID=66428 RepID=A0A7K3RRU7_9ACTN|nr:hypothetical protein [Streptomyces parvus]NEC17946.1 hypothetical protein [Streptomyces parvus]